MTNVKLNEKQLLEHLRENLKVVESLCKIYDDGNPYISFTLATEVRKILTDNPIAVRTRGELRFPTVEDPYRSGNVLPENKLVVASINFKSDGGEGEIPRGVLRFQAAATQPNVPIQQLKFREWWNRDIIFRAGAAPEGSPQNHIPVSIDQQIARPERKTLTRRDFVDQMRNKFGAHVSDEIPEVLDRLQRADYFGIDVRLDYKGGSLSLSDGTIETVVGAAAAMMRQIAHEVRTAYAADGVDVPRPIALT